MDADQFRKAAHAAIEDIITYNANLASHSPLPSIQPGYLAPLLPTSAPYDPQPWSDIQADIGRTIQPGLTHWQSPHFMAFFPAGVTYPSILGEMYSAAFNAPAFNWLCSPACTELETIVLDWVAQALALPKVFLSTSANGGGGVIQGSASESVVTCMVAARERWVNEVVDAMGLEDESREKEDKLAELRSKLVAIGSDQAHSSIKKAAAICGVRYRDVKCGLDTELAMTGDGVKKVLEQCESEGLVPFFLATTMGTTSTCAVDRWEEITSVLKTWQSEKPQRGRVWVHVDAAYAGSALVKPEFQHHCKNFEEGVDSFDFNMHKWLLVNFDASCLFIRCRTDLTRALSANPHYLHNKYSASGLVTDYRDWQIPLGRRFRALKIWFVIRTYGISGLQANIQNSLNVGNVFADLIRQRSDVFQLVAKPAFALTVFRIKTPDAPAVPELPMVKFEDEALEKKIAEITKEVYETVNQEAEIYITSSVVDGVYCIRVVSANPNADEKYVRRAFDIILKVAEKVLAKQN